jgi:DNA-binding transcriptional LysR family regulator
MNDISIKCFLCVADTLNFTIAAERLYMTQQGVSKQIAKLEDELGEHLFIRSTRDVKLTYAGQVYYKVFSDFMAGLRDAQNKVERHHNMVNNVIKIGILFSIMIPKQIIELVGEFRKENPEIRVQLERFEMWQLVRKFEEGTLDMIITYRPTIERKVDLKKCTLITVSSFGMVLTYSEKYPGWEKLCTIDDFKNQKFFTHSDDADYPLSIKREEEIRSRFIKDMASCGIEAADVEVYPNKESVETAVEMGLGIGRCSSLNTFCSEQGVHTFTLPGVDSELVIACGSDGDEACERFKVYAQGYTWY